MRRFRREALLCAILPAAAVIAVGAGYLLSGRLAAAATEGAEGLDLLVWAVLIVGAAIPPAWGYRKVAGLSRELEEHSAAVRQEVERRYRERLHALDVEKARLDAILQHMADGILLVDGKKRIQMLNPAAEQMLSIAARDAIGRDHLEVTHHFDLDERLTRVLLTGEPESLEIRRAQPRPQVLEARLALAGAGPDSGVLIMLRDMTRARQLEQMRTQFVSNVTHELRTPLTSIRGFAETLLEGALEEPETARHFVEIMKCESDHLGALIDDLLDLSRIESGKFRMRREHLLLQELIPEIIARMAPRAAQKEIQLTVDAAPDLPYVEGDSARLTQVLVNLVDNAIKYTPAGGRVAVSAVPEQRGVCLKVSDTGVGIPPADQARIFERFYRVDKARARASGGTGLGLSIVKHIVEAHGGTIAVQSEVGRGTTFTVRLPPPGTCPLPRSNG